MAITSHALLLPDAPVGIPAEISEEAPATGASSVNLVPTLTAPVAYYTLRSVALASA